MGHGRRFPAFEHPQPVCDPSLKIIFRDGGEITPRRSPFSVVVSLGSDGSLKFNGSLGEHGSLTDDGSLCFNGSLKIFWLARVLWFAHTQWLDLYLWFTRSFLSRSSALVLSALLTVARRDCFYRI